ncbi:HET-domain-containing protein [Annulohypoxylon moriforme]|nr:HET-domain-containing protein [Annulohypoxylon moriforme]
MTTNLCGHCKALKLSAASFMIGDNVVPSQSSDHPLQTIHGRHDMGTMTRIRDTIATCELCALIAYTVRSLPSETHQDDVTCYLLWEIDGRSRNEAFAKPTNGDKNKLTRRLRICWDDKELKEFEASLILVAPAKYNKSDINYPGLLNHETQFLGRHIGSQSSKKNLIREFLRLCENNHEGCQGKLGIEDPFAQTLKEPYFGVIDIENQKLTPLPYSDDGEDLVFEAYATVSYVWGEKKTRHHSTRMATIQSRLKSGGLADVIKNLPKALQQSIDLVHSLGIRYIWIDCLCIVQDSSHSFELNSQAMHLIYGNSTLTICAAEGGDAREGLLALDEAPQQMTATIAQGTNLILHRPSEASIETTNWNKRAWTFQERLLSKRCLIFTEKKIYFQCRSTSMSEDIFADKKGKGWSLDLVRAPLQTLSQLKSQALWFYINCVSLYTKRSLWEPFDILAAFSGMCKLMEETLEAPFTFGLPISHFDFAILWEPTGKSTRLTEPRSSDDPKYKDMRFPSWSWCGWKSEGAAYKRDMVEGCLADIRRWLLGRTWIDWHIRDGYGTLRRLWDDTCVENEKQDSRWRGYAKPKQVGLVAVHVDESTSTTDVDADVYSVQSRPTSVSPVRRRYRASIRSRGPVTKITRQEDNKLAPTNPTTRYIQERVPKLYNDPSKDRFGRPLQDMREKPRSEHKFTLTLPEDPYHVRTAESNLRLGDSSSTRAFPDQIFLQFFTWRTHFYLAHSTPSSQPDPRRSPCTRIHSENHTSESLSRCHILDNYGDKCGSILVDNEWLEEKTRSNQSRFEFIAISEAKSFTDEEFTDWTYYIPLERAECDWKLYYVLLVEYYPEEGIYRRVALGKVFQEAFSHSDDEWKEIILG